MTNKDRKAKEAAHAAAADTHQYDANRWREQAESVTEDSGGIRDTAEIASEAHQDAATRHSRARRAQRQAINRTEATNPDGGETGVEQDADQASEIATIATTEAKYAHTVAMAELDRMVKEIAEYMVEATAADILRVYLACS